MSTAYTYTAAHPHAAVAAGANTYQYDADGNMTCRQENGSWFIQSYNAENRLSSVTTVRAASNGGTPVRDGKLASGDCTTPGNYAGVWNFSGACPERSVAKSKGWRWDARDSTVHAV